MIIAVFRKVTSGIGVEIILLREALRSTPEAIEPRLSIHLIVIGIKAISEMSKRSDWAFPRQGLM